METPVELQVVAYFRTRKTQSYEAARQGTEEVSDEIGEIHFLPGHQFEQALEGVEKFSHLWLIYQFHRNSNWKPKVLPPRGSPQKIGVFATRSPYRPNALGISCVEVVGRKGLVVQVKNFDLLNETPIFDIKPYIAYADSFPEARLGWLEGIEEERFEIEFSPRAKSQISFLTQSGLPELKNFLLQQLSFDPTNSKKKRVEMLSERHGTLAYRTWRVKFEIFDKVIEIKSIYSGYTESEIKSPDDPYQDKSLHQSFLSQAAIGL